MFEAQIAQARNIVARLETNVGLSSGEFAALPEHLKVRREEVEAWEEAVTLGITECFGQQSDEMSKWQRTVDQHLERGDFSPEGSIRLYAARLAVLQALDGKLAMAKSRTPEQKVPIVVQGGLSVGDTYHVGQAGAVGPNSQASNNTFQQVWNQMQGTLELPVLASELGKLKIALHSEATEPDHHIAIGAVSAAESAAKAGDGPKALEYLKKCGTWVLDIASKVGVNVASSAIKGALGLP